MPATSAKQKKFFDAAANNPAFAKKVGIPSKVAKEYSQASKGQTFKEGGTMKKENPFMEMIAKKKEAAAKKPVKKMSRGGGIEIRGKTKGKMLARGGKTC
jgi:hypothetical protein